MRLGDIECWIEGDEEILDEYGAEVRGREGVFSVDTFKGWPSTWRFLPPEACLEYFLLVFASLAVCMLTYTYLSQQAISIVWKDTDRSRATSADVLVDGTNCGGYILDTSRKWDEVCREYVRTSATEKRRLQFGALQLTDDDTYLTKDRRNVGEISVALWRCRVTRKGQTPMGGRRIESSLVHEKVKKGLAHTVTLGDAIKVAPSTGKRSERLDDEPLATFLFRYRGIDVLRANGIVAMSKLLTSSSSESAASATDAEVGQKRKASEELVSGREVKPEIVDIEHLVQVEKRDRQAEEEFRRARLEMLREQGRKNIKIEDVSTIISGEVIDLTDD